MTERAPDIHDNTAGPAILDAASILLIDRAQDVPRVLMGLRQATNVFLPSKWVFPGGRLEPADALVSPATALNASDECALAARLGFAPIPPVFPQSLAMAAVRELFEETGHALALRTQATANHEGLPDGPWATWRSLGLTPCISPLRFIARAITPPGRPRRYDTRFFIARREDVIEGAAAADGEFADLAWFTLAQAQALDLPTITRRILTDLDNMLKNPTKRTGYRSITSVAAPTGATSSRVRPRPRKA